MCVCVCFVMFRSFVRVHLCAHTRSIVDSVWFSLGVFFSCACVCVWVFESVNVRVFIVVIFVGKLLFLSVILLGISLYCCSYWCCCCCLAVAAATTMMAARAAVSTCWPHFSSKKFQVQSKGKAEFFFIFFFISEGKLTHTINHFTSLYNCMSLCLGFLARSFFSSLIIIFLFRFFFLQSVGVADFFCIFLFSFAFNADRWSSRTTTMTTSEKKLQLIRKTAK